MCSVGGRARSAGEVCREGCGLMCMELMSFDEFLVYCVRSTWGINTRAERFGASTICAYKWTNKFLSPRDHDGLDV